MPEELHVEIHAWMEDTANIGALYRELKAADTALYNPHATPPMTSAKQRIIDAGQSAK